MAFMSMRPRRSLASAGAILVATTGASCPLFEGGCPQGAGIVYIGGTSEMVICNGHYRAILNRTTGGLRSASRRDTATGGATLRRDRIRIRLDGQTSSIDLGDVDATLTVEESFNFYVRIRSRRSITHGVRTIYIDRSYEFTQSPHIYEHLRVFVTSDHYIGGLAPFEVRIDRLDWLFEVSGQGTWVTTSIDDRWIRNPDSDYGGRRPVSSSNWRRGFVRTPQDTRPPSSYGRLIVMNGRFMGAPAGSEIAEIRPGFSYLAGAIITMGTRDQEWPLLAKGDPNNSQEVPGSFLQERACRFYPGFGLWEDGDPGTGSFANPNTFELLEDIIPASNTASSYSEIQRDCLVRTSMHMRQRLAMDDGWPRLAAWSRYPEGDVFTVTSRAFPPVLYTWAMLTWRRDGNGWHHEPAPADVLLDALQTTRPFYTARGDPNFEDSHQSVPYLSYSAARKESTTGLPKGVLNSHAQALHFAWLMAEAHTAAGRLAEAADWNSVVLKYHAGTKLLLSKLYPARNGPTVYWGIASYSIDEPLLGVGRDNRLVGYSEVSFEGLPAGYLAEGTGEPGFTEVVERASRTDYDPLTAGYQPPPHESFIGRLCRAFPPAMAFSGLTVRMADRIAAASLAEVMTLGAAMHDATLPPAITQRHESSRMIVNPQTSEYILANRRFRSFWLDGFWEEVDLTAVPPSARYLLREVAGSAYYGIVRRGNHFELMTDLPVELELHVMSDARNMTFTKSVSTYGNHSWAAPVRGRVTAVRAGPPGYVVVPLGLVSPKDLISVDLH